MPRPRQPRRPSSPSLPSRATGAAKQVDTHYYNLQNQNWSPLSSGTCTPMSAGLRSVFEGLVGILAVYYSSFRHVLLADFATRKAAHKARNNKLYGRGLRDRSLDIASFSNDNYVLDRDSPVSSWARPGTSVCVQGFDSSRHVEEIRSMLARHFFGGCSNNDEGIVRVPADLDGSSIGKAYIKCGSWCCFSEALNLNRSKLEGRKLSVTECKGAVDSGMPISRLMGLVTGKRKLFNDDSDDN